MTENLEYNRLNNLTSYRELLHETTKRKIASRYERSSGNFRMNFWKWCPFGWYHQNQLLLCFHWSKFWFGDFRWNLAMFFRRGIPAMARGKQIVVAGDSQQLRPEIFFDTLGRRNWRSRCGVESLLELATTSVSLRCRHYRSASPNLVEFSNHHFYNDKLEVSCLRKLGRLSRYLKTDGVWHEQTNQVEADKVAELVLNAHKNINQRDWRELPTNHSGCLVMDAIEKISNS